MKETKPLLEVKDLNVSFSMYKKGVRKSNLNVIGSLNLDVHAGEIVAVVGSSGSGKSLLAHAILGILPSNASVQGVLNYSGEALTPALQKKLRGTEIALIPQSVNYLDPLIRVGEQVAGVKSNRDAQRSAFKRYGLNLSVERLFPFQLSGGMARRVLVSTATTIAPKLIVADEPTPGLSVELAMETFRHFKEMAENGAAVLLITHDLDMALTVADKIAVFYAGTTVEIAYAGDFKKGRDALRHPYSKAFIDALPQNEFKAIAGKQPYAGNMICGCHFADRCEMRTDDCGVKVPMRSLRGGKVRCVNAT